MTLAAGTSRVRGMRTRVHTNPRARTGHRRRRPHPNSVTRTTCQLTSGTPSVRSAFESLCRRTIRCERCLGRTGRRTTGTQPSRNGMPRSWTWRVNICIRGVVIDPESTWNAFTGIRRRARPNRCARLRLGAKDIRRGSLAIEACSAREPAVLLPVPRRADSDSVRPGLRARQRLAVSRGRRVLQKTDPRRFRSHGNGDVEGPGGQWRRPRRDLLTDRRRRQPFHDEGNGCLSGVNDQ